MAYRKFLLILLYLGLIFLLVSSIAQDNFYYPEKVLDSSEIKDLADLAKYDKTVKKLKLKKGDLGETEIPESNFSFGLDPVLRGLLYVLISALVIFILFTIFSGIKVTKRIKPETKTGIEEIEDIEVIDAESGLEVALKAENYREAIRMLFIKLLQILVEENSIQWKPEKTNRDYLKEMKNHDRVRHFNNLVIAYERIWYGSEPIDKLFFDYLRADYEKFYSTKNVSIDVKE